MLFKDKISYLVNFQVLESVFQKSFLFSFVLLMKPPETVTIVRKRFCIFTNLQWPDLLLFLDCQACMYTVPRLPFGHP